MNKITFPLKTKQRGNAVLHLQDRLLLLIEKNPSVFIPSPHIPKPPDWPAIIKPLKEERSDKYYGEVTKRLIISFQTVSNFQASGSVDEQTAKALNRSLDKLNEPEKPVMYTVKGTVRLTDNDPAIKTTVLAFHQNLRSEQELGKGQADEQGFYQIQYSPQQLTRYKKGRAGLVVKAVDENGKLLATSPVLFNAPPSAKVNLRNL